MVFFIWPFFFVFWFFSSIHNTHTPKQMIKIVKLSLFTTSCIEEVRKDLREKKKKKRSHHLSSLCLQRVQSLGSSLPYVCRECKALGQPIWCGVTENRNQLCALVVVSSQYHCHSFPPIIFLPPWLSSPVLAFAKTPEVGDQATCLSRNFRGMFGDRAGECQRPPSTDGGSAGGWGREHTRLWLYRIVHPFAFKFQAVKKNEK